MLLRVFKSPGAASAIYSPRSGSPGAPRTDPEPAHHRPVGAARASRRLSASLPSCWVALPSLTGINRALGVPVVPRRRPPPPRIWAASHAERRGPRRGGRPRSAAREGDSCRRPSGDLFPLTAGPQVTCVGGDE